MRAWVLSFTVFIGCGSVSRVEDTDPDGAPTVDARGGGPDAASLDAADTPGPRCDAGAPFGQPRAVAELNTTSADDSAFLTDDELTIYFSSNRGALAAWNIYIATRATRDEPFGAPDLLRGVPADQFERHATVTDDGLSLYGYTAVEDSDRSSEIAVATRADRGADFGPLVPVPALNIGLRDANPYVVPNHNAVYFDSDVDPGDAYSIYRAARTDTGFEPPEPVVGVNIGSGLEEVVPVVTRDELTMFFASARTGTLGRLDIWATGRTVVDGAFSDPENVTELNGEGDEFVSWVSTDGCVVYLTRDVGTGDIVDLDLYVAARGTD